jgi:hypothetical protein
MVTPEPTATAAAIPTTTVWKDEGKMKHYEWLSFFLHSDDLFEWG